MKIEVDATHALKGLSEISSKVNDMSTLMGNLAGFLADVTEDAFQGEYDPNNNDGWAGLLPVTVKARQRKGHWPGKILQDDGNLASSITTSHGNDYAQIGTNKVYAAAHQFGIDEFVDRSGELVARPYIGFSPDDASEMEDMIADFLRL